MKNIFKLLKKIFFKNNTKENIFSLTNEDMFIYIEKQIFKAQQNGFSCVDLSFPLSIELIDKLQEKDYSISSYKIINKELNVIQNTKICW